MNVAPALVHTVAGRPSHRRLLIYTHLSSSAGTDVYGFSCRNEQLTPVCCSFGAATAENSSQEPLAAPA